MQCNLEENLLYNISEDDIEENDVVDDIANVASTAINYNDSNNNVTGISNEFRNSHNCWDVFRACLNTIVHFLIGASVFVTLWFAFKSTPITTFQWHIGLNMIGYQLLMSHAILSLNNFNGWSSPLTFTHRRRAHWILQFLGSIAAIIGSVIMMKEKTVNFNTTHGKLGLAALTFTSGSVINGIISMYTVELRCFLAMQSLKNVHRLLGITAFALSTTCLAFGYLKKSFKQWVSDEFAYLMIGVTSAYTVIIVASPCFTLYKHFK